MSLPAQEKIAANSPTLSVAIIAQDEEQNLRRLLPAIVGLANEIVLVDSGSTDGTVALAASYGARVIAQPWLGFGPQKNFAIAQCTGDWILSLDADEEPDTTLRAAIPRALAAAPSATTGYLLRRRNFFLGRAMRYGGYYPDAKLRLVRRGQAAYKPDLVHESMQSDGRLSLLAGNLLHHAYPTLHAYIEHMDRYSSASVLMLRARGKHNRSFPALVWNALLNPWATFVYNYGLRGGFLDGAEGLLLHLYHSVYISWKYAKLWEAERIPPTQVAKD